MNTNSLLTTNMKMLVKFEDNWADEMDLVGFRIFSDTEWQEYRDKAQDIISFNGNLTVSFGTNEENEYTEYEDFIEKFSVTAITEEQSSAIVSLFGDSYGVFPLV